MAAGEPSGSYAHMATMLKARLLLALGRPIDALEPLEDYFRFRRRHHLSSNVSEKLQHVSHWEKEVRAAARAHPHRSGHIFWAFKLAGRSLTPEELSFIPSLTKHVTRCSYCFSKGPCRACGRCGRVRYCSAKCQQLAWPSHRDVCRKKPAPV